MSYSIDPHWRAIQSFLPADLRLGPGIQPAEEWWSWRGHRVHLDCYRDRQAPAKLILFHGVGQGPPGQHRLDGGSYGSIRLHAVLQREACAGGVERVPALRAQAHGRQEVHLVCPGEFDSPMVDELDRNRTAENRAHTLTVPKASVTTIARDTLAGVQAGRFLIIPGAPTRAAAFGIRHLPAVSRALGDRAIARAGRR